jgi:hypothetical protein
VSQIEGEFEGLLDHVGDDAVEEGTAAIEAGVGVDLDQPRLKILIDHEVQPQNLEVVHLVSRCNLGENTPCSIGCHLLHSRYNLLSKIILLLLLMKIQVKISLKLLIRQFVIRLVFAVFWIVLLDGIVGEMDLWFEGVYVEIV